MFRTPARWRSGTVASEARRKNQYPGYELAGGTATDIGAKPMVVQACMGNEGHDGPWSSVALDAGSTGGLAVQFGLQIVYMPNTPVP